MLSLKCIYSSLWDLAGLSATCLALVFEQSAGRLVSENPFNIRLTPKDAPLKSSDFELLASQQSPAETPPGPVPTTVERAMTINFGIAITGFLCCALYDQSINCLVGIVYRESRGRFRDGSTIRTSTLRRRIEHGVHHLFETRNGSVYVVCDWAQEGGSPQFEGALH